MSSAEAPLVSIGELSSSTGVAVATLRAWETRFGFPTPARTSSGHRRYAAQQVHDVRDVLAARDAGLSLAAAVAQVRSAGPDTSGSLFAELRARHPTLAVQRLSRDAMLAVSTAIEDEMCARGERPLLFGFFQEGARYRARARRWAELGRTAELAVVFAEFDGRPRPGRDVVEVALPAGAPVRREWAVVCLGRRMHACLAGWETPDRIEGRRTFEASWSVRPDVVATGARFAVALAAQLGAELPQGVAARVVPERDPESLAAAADALLVRVAAELDRRSGLSRG